MPDISSTVRTLAHEGCGSMTDRGRSPDLRGSVMESQRGSAIVVTMDEAPSSSPTLPYDNSCRFTMKSLQHDELVVAVHGDLDPPSARILLEIVETAIGAPGSNQRVEVDLRRLRACSNSGVRALTACAELGAGLREGLQFRLGRIVDAPAGDAE
jgi:hypothetical protein